MTEEIYVYVIDFGVTSISETVTKNDDGSYTIFLNARFSYEQQKKAYNHALCHIQRNDFDRYDVDMIENECHRITWCTR